MKKGFEFKDQSLSAVVQKSASQFSDFQRHLNETSEDIKNLEKWFQECGVCVPATVQIKNSCVGISWSKYEDSWRLICDASDDDGPDIRPLIEMPARMRLFCRPHLPKLVQEVADLLPAGQKEEIPF